MSKQLYTSDICVSGGNDKWSCHRPAVSDGYCKIHHPDAVAAIQHKNGNNCDHRAQLSITNYGPCVVCGESQDSILMKRIAALEAEVEQWKKAAQVPPPEAR